MIHGYQNDSLEPVYFQVMIGRGKPETMGYADDELFKRRADHLKAVWFSDLILTGAAEDPSRRGEAWRPPHAEKTKPRFAGINR